MAFRPDYSPIERSAARRAKAMSGLGAVIGGVGRERREAGRLAAHQDLAQEALAGDQEALDELAVVAPELSQQVMTRLGARTEQQQKGLVYDFANVLNMHEAGDQQGALNYMDQRIETIEARGGDSSHTRQMRDFYAANPEQGGRALSQSLLRMMDPQQFAKTLVPSGGKDTRTPDVKNYEYAVGQGYKGSLLEYQAEGKDPDGRTNAIKEYEYGLAHPGFVAARRAKEDSKRTKAASGKAFENTSKLRKEFLSQSSEYQKVRDSYTRVVGSTADPSPAGDLSLIFNYMKMLDPGSVVRESEFATAASAGSYGERTQALVQKILSGKRLTEAMREDFLKKSGVLLKGMQDQHSKREKSYRNIAEKNNLPVDEVVVDITAPPEYREGQTATGPQGEKIVFTNGEWRPM